MVEKDIRSLVEELDEQPEDRIWTPEEVDTLDNLRHEAHRLVMATEAILEELQGD